MANSRAYMCIRTQQRCRICTARAPTGGGASRARLRLHGCDPSSAAHAPRHKQPLRTLRARRGARPHKRRRPHARVDEAQRRLAHPGARAHPLGRFTRVRRLEDAVKESARCRVTIPIWAGVARKNQIRLDQARMRTRDRNSGVCVHVRVSMCSCMCLCARMRANAGAYLCAYLCLPVAAARATHGNVHTKKNPSTT